MTETPISSEEETAQLCAIGRTIHDTRLKAILEPEHNSKNESLSLFVLSFGR